MTIRRHPELFEDVISEDRTSSSCEDYLAFEGKKYQAIAGGYVRAVVARLVFLDYIDTRCNAGSAPRLHAVSVECERKPAVKELVFGLKVFLRAGKAILAHCRNDPRASHDNLSLAASCFYLIKQMSRNNREAAEELKDLLDEAFDTFSLLPNAASQFGENADKSSDDMVGDWPSLLIGHLKRAKSLLDDFCDLSSDDSHMTVSQVAILQRYLPSLARLCYKHGSHFVKIDDFIHANEALHIALQSTDWCLREVRQALKEEKDPLNDDDNGKGKRIQRQVLHNLEADLVVVSIEAFYAMSHIFQSTGKQEKALQCLDMIENYMKEQQDRDDQLYTTAINKVEKDFLFSEGDITASIEGPKNQDKIDIKTRATTARANAKKRHFEEKATLAYCRIMIYHKALPHPSCEEELLIDKLLRELVDLSSTFIKTANSSVPSARKFLGVAGYNGTRTTGGDRIFTLAINAIRVVRVRRILSDRSGQQVDGSLTGGDPYKALLDKVPKTDVRRPFIQLDRLNAMLTARYQMENHPKNVLLDDEYLCLAREYVESLKSFSEQSTVIRGNRDPSDGTLFAASGQSICNDLFRETQAHFARVVSLYHSIHAHKLCAQYAEMLEAILRLTDRPNYSGFESNDIQLGEVIVVKAHALSMSGNSTDACKAAREAWEKVKNIDSMVTLFHCSLCHEIKYSSCDALLELDTAINDLSICGPVADEILAAFPRLSNSCVETEQGGGELMLLGVQERWTKMLVGSKLLHQLLEERTNGGEDTLLKLGGHRVFEVLRAYLENFEHVLQRNQDPQKALIHCETLPQVVGATLGFIIAALRDTKSHKTLNERRKRKEKQPEFVLIWDDSVVEMYVGNRADCVWIAEQLWNISNKLMMISFGADRNDSRKYSSQLFAAAHDFCLLSEEEVGASLSKDYLDFDVEYQLDNLATPTFDKSNESFDCDISSEFSGQCLLLSAATAVDLVTNLASTSGDMKNLLHRSLHRLSRAQDEFLLNCEDEVQMKDVNKMIALLTLRCLVGIEDDSLAYDIISAAGLGETLLEFCKDELPVSASPWGILQNVYLMACCAEEKKMVRTFGVLLRSCASHMSRTGQFVIELEQSLSLGELQRKIIQSASTSKEVLEIYNDIDRIVKKHREEVGDIPDSSVSIGSISFYSQDELDWLTIQAYNQGVSLTLLGDFQSARVLFATALNIIPMCSKEVQGHTKTIHAAYQHSLTKRVSMGESIASILGEVGF
eukprot:CCRYP_001018-RA/>CCRYP_001018-RA protein AED:0.02 eAED:0.02 QI:978/1/1/1/0.71/0.62/8/2038/1234